MNKETLVRFPAGAPLSRSEHDRMTVATLVRTLTEAKHRLDVEPAVREMKVDLCDLAGVSDRTVDMLSTLVRQRVLAPACAARLTLRHACELDGHPPTRSAADLRDAPLLMEWKVYISPIPHLTGIVLGHPWIPDGHVCHTSELFTFDPTAGYARTLSRFYRLLPRPTTSN